MAAGKPSYQRSRTFLAKAIWAASVAVVSISVEKMVTDMPPIFGAGAEIRTRTLLRAAEFKSAASAVPPLRRGGGCYLAARAQPSSNSTLRTISQIDQAM